MEEDNELYKITFERVKDGKQAYFFINGISGILDEEYFNHVCRDAKTNESFAIKEKIIQQLTNPNT